MEEFKTSDLGIAAYLICSGVEFIRAEGATLRKDFVFKREAMAPELVTEYWTERARVSPRKFYYALRFLKNAAHNTKPNETSQFIQGQNHA